jgi:hypothetical protein
MRGFAALVAAILAVTSLAGQPYPWSTRLVYHEVRHKSGYGIQPWSDPDPAKAYDHVIRIVWDFWRGMRACPNGVPYYLQHQVWQPEQDDPRGLGGDQLAMALSSWNLLHAYLGDPAVVSNMRLIADHYLAHGLTPAAAAWPNVPYPYNADAHAGRYDGDMRAGKGFVQPDKAGSFGHELVTLHRITGEPKYLDAAVRIADTLARHVTPGSAAEGPWPFRVHAVRPGTKPDAGAQIDYTSNWTGALRLFEGLVALRAGDTTSYARAHDLVIAWLKQYPLRTNNWGPFFEDIPSYSNTAINAGTMALYVLERREAWGASWRDDARGILDWADDTFHNDEFLRWNVRPINEQTVYRLPGNSHTSRQAATELFYAERTGDWTRKDDSIRRLNWATYMVDTDGKNRYYLDDVWLTDGYGDYVRHYLRAMAASPDLAPADQNHLLRSSSVVQSIAYGDDAITYRKFDDRSVERLKLGAWAPGVVTGGTLRWDAGARVAEIDATATTVRIARAR